jgi:hypothetical protein
MKRQIKFKQIKQTCPEEYEARMNNRLVGLVTLRWGRLECIYLPYGCYYKNEEVLKSHLFENRFKGNFADANERHAWLGEFRNLLHERNEANIKRLEDIRLKKLNRNKFAQSCFDSKV